MRNPTSGQPVGGGVACADLTIPKPSDAASKKSQPHAALHGIGGQIQYRVLVFCCGPGNRLHLITRRHPKQTAFLIGDPYISRSVFGKTVHVPARNGNRHIPAAFQVAHSRLPRNPDSPTRILKKGHRWVTLQSANDNLAHARHPSAALSRIHRYLTVLYAAKASGGAGPNGAIPGLQNGPADL